MAFSSRTPRSQGRRVTLSRAGARQSRPAARYLRLWEAIRLTREELDHWQHRAAQVDSLFRQHILPRETRFTNACLALTDRLMDRYEAVTLTSDRQALLTLWITANLRSLDTHPFVAVTQRNALSQRWQRIQREESDRAAELQVTSARAAAGVLYDALDDDELDEDDVIFDFGWHDPASTTCRGGSAEESVRDGDERNTDAIRGGAKRTGVHDEAGAAPDDPAQAEDQTGYAAAAVDARVSELEKRLSVERLFRQLARVLHPDREQDETLKAQKHELMSQCLKARRDKDINTLLTLYCQHVGDLPDDLSATDHEDLIDALQMQLRRLQNELRQQRFADPLRVQIVERYSGTDEQQTLLRVMHHARSLDAESEHLETLRQSLDADDALVDALEARRGIELDCMVIDQMTGYSGAG